MSRSKSSSAWLRRQKRDAYVKMALQQGYRSRAAYKLVELNQRDHILKAGMTVVDLGAAPGGWSQVARDIVGTKGKVIAMDILPMEALPGVDFIQGDFRQQQVLDVLQQNIPHQVDLVMSDMAPNISGIDSVDQPKAMHLAELALELAKKVLIAEGDLLIKLFQGAGFQEFIQSLRQHFVKVVIRKPGASRRASREVYVLARQLM